MINEGIVDHQAMAKELIKRHGKDVTMQHIDDMIDGADDAHKVDKSEVLYHLKKLKDVKEGDEYDEKWKEYKGKSFKKEQRMLNFNDYLKEAALSAKQKKIAAIAGDKDKIDADDLAALRAGKKPVEEAKKCMDEDDMDESGLRMAAHAAHKQGKKEFEFQGKTYPVKVQKEGVLKPELEKGFPAPGVKTGASAPKGTTYMPKKAVKEETDKHNIYHEMEKHGETYLHHHDSYDHDDRDVDRYYIKKQDHHRDAAEDALKKGNKKEMHAHLAQFYKHAGEAHDYAGRDDESAEASELEHHHHKLAGGTHVKEEVEQIEELSKKTLGSYVKKAAHDARMSGQVATDFENRADRVRIQSKKDSNERLHRKYLGLAWKRDAGIAKAVDKLTKEDVQLDEGKMKELAMDLKDMSHDEFHKQYGKPKSHFDPTNFKKPVQPGKEMERARALAQRGIQSLSKEEVERIEEKLAQLDELSPATLKSYRKGIARDIDRAIDASPHGTGDDDEDRKLNNRVKGDELASKKLAAKGVNPYSEEVERIEELSKKTLGSYAHKATDDAQDKAHDAYDIGTPTRHELEVQGGKNNKGEYGHKPLQNRLTGVARAAKKLGDKGISKDVEKSVAHHLKQRYHYDNMDDGKAARSDDAALRQSSKAHEKIRKASGVKEEVEQEQSPYLKATLSFMDESKYDDYKDALRAKKATQSAFDKDFKPDTTHPHIQVVKGTQYGGENQKDDEGDEKPEAEKEKRGRGRPSGSKSGARLKGGGHEDGGIPVHQLHLPKSYK